MGVRSDAIHDCNPSSEQTRFFDDNDPLKATKEYNPAADAKLQEIQPVWLQNLIRGLLTPDPDERLDIGGIMQAMKENKIIEETAKLDWSQLLEAEQAVEQDGWTLGQLLWHADQVGVKQPNVWKDDGNAARINEVKELFKRKIEDIKKMHDVEDGHKLPDEDPNLQGYLKMAFQPAPMRLDYSDLDWSWPLKADLKATNANPLKKGDQVISIDMHERYAGQVGIFIDTIADHLGEYVVINFPDEKNVRIRPHHLPYVVKKVEVQAPHCINEKEQVPHSLCGLEEYSQSQCFWCEVVVSTSKSTKVYLISE